MKKPPLICAEGVSRVTHFSQLVPSQPGTMRRTGKPWMAGVSPFMLRASSVAGCMALRMGRERTKSGVAATPASAPSYSRKGAPSAAPAIFSTSETRGPRHSAFPTAPRPHWIPGTLGL